ncbi:tetratricopeptide repeat protein [Thermophagus sp. OGC60D27]|uniref:tetratricopeptide repeat protein n=1 Tax=Thermophagus sp. OGC60D27 TaxID=3458415 RepID=UPI0040384B48
MARMRLIDLLSDPGKLDDQTLVMLKEVLETYPFFQAGRMLWIKNLHVLDHIRFNSELKLAAAYIPDRSKLFFLINDMPVAAPAEPAPQPVDVEAVPEDMINSGQDQPQEIDVRVPEEDQSAPDSLLTEKEEETVDGRVDDPAQKTGDDANYFNVDDIIISATGEEISLSELSGNPFDDGSEDAGNESVEEASHDLILPAADLLDYERDISSKGFSVEYDLSQPPVVDFNESRSFSEWLYLLRHQPIHQEPTAQPEERDAAEKPKQRNKMNLIDNFLNNAGSQKRIVPGDDSSLSDQDFSVKSLQESDDLMTETLANIHIKQGRYQKAIEIFERLRLKYPEKSVYFADRIKEMEDLINNQ